MGQDGIDTDLPTQFELLCLNNILGKIFFSYVCLIIFVSHHYRNLSVFLEHSKYYFMLCDRHSSVRSASHAGTHSTYSLSLFSTLL